MNSERLDELRFILDSATSEHEINLIKLAYDIGYTDGYNEGCWDTTIRHDLSTEDPVLERLARKAMEDYQNGL